MSKNGLRSFIYHAEDEDKPSQSKPYALNKLAETLKKVKLGRKTDNWKGKLQEEFEYWLNKTVLQESEAVRNFVASNYKQTETSKLECLNIQKIRLTHTHLVKCQQKYNGIPVYGAQVTVEVDADNNELLAINSFIANSIDKVDPSPKIQLYELQDLIKEKTGHDLRDINITPTLYYYFDPGSEKWRLVYLVEKRLHDKDAPFKSELIPYMVDYLIDACTGELVSQLPRVKTLK